LKILDTTTDIDAIDEVVNDDPRDIKLKMVVS